MKFSMKSNAGFSLVELMIVVGIIGILATIAVPKFQSFQSKARMAEAKTMLTQIYTLEEAYHLDNNAYITFNTAAAPYGRLANGTLSCARAGNIVTLGFTIQPCQGAVPRFGYYVAAATNNTFTATATTGAGANNLVCPGDVATLFDINQDRVMTNNPSSCQN
jgi:prepilin-type N-terminal cleavage/methylation domain-containing protein